MVSKLVVSETMVATSSTMASSSTSSSFSSSSVNVLNQPLLLLSNMANMMTIKLDNTNYILWKHQITMVLETYSLFELIEEPQLTLQGGDDGVGPWIFLPFAAFCSKG